MKNIILIIVGWLLLANPAHYYAAEHKGKVVVGKETIQVVREMIKCPADQNIIIPKPENNTIFRCGGGKFRLSGNAIYIEVKIRIK